MVSRPCCTLCHYPQNSCLCAAISFITPTTQIVILQHPSEVKHKKNSVRLLNLTITNLRIYIGETAQDFNALQAYLDQCGKPIYLVYPSADSQCAATQPIDTECVLLLLDGTWRKVFKLLQLNPWLHHYPALHLPLGTQTRYRIRKSSRPDSLSTLEACAYMLNALEPTLDTRPLFNVFDAMVDMQLNAMSPATLGRYTDKQ